MFGREYDTAFDLCFGDSRQHCREVEYELRSGMRYYREVGILPLRYFLVEFYIYLMFLL